MRAMIKVTLYCCNPLCKHTAEVLLMETNDKGVMPMHDYMCAKCLTLMTGEITQEVADAYRNKQTEDNEVREGSEGLVREDTQ